MFKLNLYIVEYMFQDHILHSVEYIYWHCIYCRIEQIISNYIREERNDNKSKEAMPSLYKVKPKLEIAVAAHDFFSLYNRCFLTVEH